MPKARDAAIDRKKSKEPLGRFAVDLCGKAFARLTVVQWAGRNWKGDLLWECLCDCGTSRVVLGRSLTSGTCKSCGCLNLEVAISSNTKHGMSRTAIYHAWVAMIERCDNPKNKAYKNYGGRGITVCERWRESVANFVADMGPRPSKRHTLDRINNDGNYEPTNCRWATWDVQSRNKRKMSVV
jgi:hypothetical protein